MPDWIVGTAVVSIIVLGVVVLVELLVVTALLYLLRNLIAEARERMEPLLDKAEALLETARVTAQDVKQKAEHIGEKTAHTTDVVGDRVEKVSAVIHRLVAAPLVQGAAIGEGVRRGVREWRRSRGVPATPLCLMRTRCRRWSHNAAKARCPRRDGPPFRRDPAR
ncbi:MAG TPA: hypothetical protein PLZ36_14050 [Armatimonadota bacterium]|nr:hypothetical protein [Armatimonadota bacterium]